MHLEKLFSKFKTRHGSYSSRMLEIYDSIGSCESWEINYKTEVLISDIWQFWCNFCRELYFSSMRGTSTRSNNSIIGVAANKDWKRIAYEAGHVLNPRRCCTSNGHLNYKKRFEPTWGDIDVIQTIINGVNPNNKNTLLSGFGSFYKLKDLQNVRNACAHKNIETKGEVLQLSTNYSFSHLKYVTDLAWIRDRTTGAMALEVWLDEMYQIANIVTS